MLEVVIGVFRTWGSYSTGVALLLQIMQVSPLCSAHGACCTPHDRSMQKGGDSHKKVTNPLLRMYYYKVMRVLSRVCSHICVLACLDLPSCCFARSREVGICVLPLSFLFWEKVFHCANNLCIDFRTSVFLAELEFVSYLFRLYSERKLYIARVIFVSISIQKFNQYPWISASYTFKQTKPQNTVMCASDLLTEPHAAGALYHVCGQWRFLLLRVRRLVLWGIRGCVHSV